MRGNHNNIAPFGSGRPTATQNVTMDLMGNYITASARFI